MKKIIAVLLAIFFVFPFLGCAGGSKTVQFSSTSNNPNQVVKVLVDDKEIGETPLTYNLTYGKHKITFDAQVINSTQEVNIDKDTESISYDTYASTISVTSKGDGPFNVSIEGEDLNYNIGYTVYLDGQFTGKTLPVTLQVSKGLHKIELISITGSSTYNANVQGDLFLNLRAFSGSTIETDGAVRVFHSSKPLDELEQYASSSKGVIFSDLPTIDACCSAALIANSGVFVNDDLTVSGITTHKEFYIKFPSAKLVKIVGIPYKDTWYSFSQEILFNEEGIYEILDENKKAFDSFMVPYRAIPLPPTKCVSELFGDNFGDAIAIRAGTNNTVKLLIVDAKGNPVANTLIDYNTKTDEKGVLTLTIKGIESRDSIGQFSIGSYKGSSILYGNLLIGVYDFVTIDKGGYVANTSIQSLKAFIASKVRYDIQYEGDDIYMPKSVLTGFNIIGGKTKTFNDVDYIAINTVTTAPDTAVIITDDEIEFYKLKELIP